MTDTVRPEGPAAIQPPARHPLDPDPVKSTKATTVLLLGVAAVLTGPLVGGVVPAAIALVLAEEARADMAAGRGFLTGARRLRLGRALAWIGIAVAVAALVAASVIGILGLVSGASQDFPPTSN
jgi:hypothetical protein